MTLRYGAFERSLASKLRAPRKTAEARAGELTRAMAEATAPSDT